MEVHISCFLLVILVFCCAGVDAAAGSSIPRGIVGEVGELGDVISQQNVCPNEEDILPCRCQQSQQFLDLDCSAVLDEGQLRLVFEANFPSKTFRKFSVLNNPHLRVLENGVFRDVTFQEIYFANGTLEEVRGDSLTSCYSTAIVLSFQNLKIFSFPLQKLAEFSVLQSLNLGQNEIHSLPPLASSSLESFQIPENPIGSVNDETFKNVKNINLIDLSHTLLTEVPSGTFSSPATLLHVRLSNTHLSYLPAGAFDLSSAQPSTVDLSFNNIDTVEVDALKGLAAGSTIDLYDNSLSELKESVWRSLLEGQVTIRLGENSLVCDCSVSWLVVGPALLHYTKDGRCADGVLLTDLDPADFEQSCRHPGHERSSHSPGQVIRGQSRR